MVLRTRNLTNEERKTHNEKNRQADSDMDELVISISVQLIKKKKNRYRQNPEKLNKCKGIDEKYMNILENRP